MHRFILVSLFLLPVLAGATPVTIQGTYLTAVDDNPEICPSGSVEVEAPSGLVGACEILLDLLITPVGGTFCYASGQTYYNTKVGVTLDILNAVGESLGMISLRGKSTGTNATAFSLQDSILLDVAPTSFALYLMGCDAQIDWKISIDSTNTILTAAAAPSIPEPVTLLTLATGSGLLALKKRSLAA